MFSFAFFLSTVWGPNLLQPEGLEAQQVALLKKENSFVSFQRVCVRVCTCVWHLFSVYEREPSSQCVCVDVYVCEIPNVRLDIAIVSLYIVISISRCGVLCLPVYLVYA
jgi:hypothetical protein